MNIGYHRGNAPDGSMIKIVIVMRSRDQTENFLFCCLLFYFISCRTSKIKENQTKDEAFLSVGLSKSLNISPKGDPGGN